VHGDSPGAALVTGAGRRIGRALALAAADAGYDVVVHFRSSRDEAQEVVEAVQAKGRRAVALQADLSAWSELNDLAHRAGDAVGPVTLLVNNASLFDEDQIGEVTQESWTAHMDANLRAPVILAQSFAAELPPGRSGLIVNMLDQRVWRPNPLFFSYTLSKAALWAATRTLAQALAPRIRVNGIGPGPTLASIHQAPGEFEAEAAATPLARVVDLEDITAAFRYLLQARSVTGQMIAVDSGQHLAWRTPDVLGG
jgi:NAD(P)-dependent dehydrogenase (short-subunit alcohol dehydrogenase family)